MAKTRTKKQVTVPRKIRVRREVNHVRDSEALERVQGLHTVMARMDQALATDTRLAEELMAPDGYYDDETNQEGNEDAEEDSDSDDGWVPIEIVEPDEIDLAIESNLERLRQEAIRFNWKNLVKDLHPVYLKQKSVTKNWTAENTYSDYTSCSCISSARRPIDLVNIYGQRRERLKFCSCTPDAVRLVQMGYLPGSPIRPVTAFSIPLLILHNCHIGAMPFTTALNQYLEPRSNRLTVRNGKHARELRKPFAAAVDLYRELVDRTEAVVGDVLRLEERAVLAARSCPACFGPSPPNLNEYPWMSQDKLIICLDGNFQHRHHSKASRDYVRIRTPNMFVSQQEVDAMKAKIIDIELRQKPKDKRDRCTEAHKAADDKHNESSWKGCDDTGLMGCCCRHDAAIYMANINKSGEQRCFPMALLNKILNNEAPHRHVGILYDIGCSLDKYMALRGLLSDQRDRLQFATSVFHAYVHSWTCQLDYNPCFNKGWGLSDGEGLERMWSYLSPLVSPLRYATRNHRLTAISHRLKYHNTRGIKNLPTWLKRKFVAAARRRVETKAALREVLDKPNPFSTTGRNFTKRFFKAQWEEQRKFKETHTEEQEENRDKLVEVYKQEAALEALRTRLRNTPSTYLASEQEAHKLLDELETTAEELRKAAESLGRDHQPEPDEAEAKSELFVQAVELWAEKQPLTDSRTIGHRLGTKLSEKIQKAIQKRRGPINKLIATFNTRFAQYVAKFPRQRVADANEHPLTYDTFESMAIDHKFWNDGIYYHSKAPWAIDPDVRSGIACILVLQRVEEELDLLTQETARTMTWAISTYELISGYIRYIRARVMALDMNMDPPEDHIDRMELGNYDRQEKLRIINKELQTRLFDHGVLIQEWTGTITWMCARCRPELLRDIYSDWNDLVQRVATDQTSRQPKKNKEEPVVDNVEEEAVVGIQVDDGEEVTSGEAANSAGAPAQSDWEDVDDAQDACD
ncbi:hypothetical protein PGTUg99_033611 [Puccinia graminis f. sp. tritici]|uniref:CxC1-like cysteine cluster associated with KDZ transposases domain-containing protein n=1 Tax=Puccinia graminis f. sp. tritici TaxID=56615 RepID=A0A5B0S8K7_PUCGR|nr:hypothetical protein PGTUg99_033611 [Puccinia graminis f. sp. tritici]